jgi:hypothetical protein
MLFKKTTISRRRHGKIPERIRYRIHADCEEMRMPKRLPKELKEISKSIETINSIFEKNKNEMTPESFEKILQILRDRKKIPKEDSIYFSNKLNRYLKECQKNQKLNIENMKKKEKRDRIKIFVLAFLAWALYCHYQLGQPGLSCGLINTLIFSFFARFHKSNIVLFLIISLSSFVVGSLLGDYFLKEFNLKNLMVVVLSSPVLTMLASQFITKFLRLFKSRPYQSNHLEIHLFVLLPMIVASAGVLCVLLYPILYPFKKNFQFDKKIEKINLIEEF